MNFKNRYNSRQYYVFCAKSRYHLRNSFTYANSYMQTTRKQTTKKQKEFELYSDSRFLKVMPRYIFAIFANLKGNERLKFKVT